MTKWTTTTSIIICYLFCDIHAKTTLFTIDYNSVAGDVKRLPRFWKNTGFAPNEPVEKVDDFFDSNDVKLNLEIIGSLPNNGINNIRIHWLLNLLSIRYVKSEQFVV